jgi:hypothetical protein
MKKHIIVQPVEVSISNNEGNEMENYVFNAKPVHDGFPLTENHLPSMLLFFSCSI